MRQSVGGDNAKVLTYVMLEEGISFLKLGYMGDIVAVLRRWLGICILGCFIMIGGNIFSNYSIMKLYYLIVKNAFK